MIQIALKKEDGRCVELTLPEQPESLKHQFQDALGQVSHQNPAYIVQAASNVSWFTNALEEMWIGDLSQLEELNRITGNPTSRRAVCRPFCVLHSIQKGGKP